MLFALALVKVLLQVAAINQYGYFRDELYYLASTHHLAWGYVDHPPLSIALLALVRQLFGDSLYAIRIVPALAGGATVAMTGLIAREVGGGRFAQALAACAALFAPEYLGLNHIYSMNSFDLLLWTASILTLVRCWKAPRISRWILLGLLLGLGLLNKISVLWLGAGIAAALILTGERRHLGTPGPWLAAILAALLFSPYIAWETAHGWPTLEFIRNASAMKNVHLTPMQYLGGQVLTMGPASAPLWIGGLLYGLFAKGAARWRGLAWLYLAVLGILLFSRSAKSEYLASAYPALFALGAVGFEHATVGLASAALAAASAQWRLAVPRGAAVLMLAALSAPVIPMALPILPVETFIRYQAALGISGGSDERHEMGPLPQHYADQFGWEEMAQAVAQVYAKLPPEDRVRCRIFATNYGEAGAIDFFGRRLGLPGAISGHNSYYFWGPGDSTAGVLIVLNAEEDEVRSAFARVERVGTFDHPYAMPYERHMPIWVAREPRAPIAAIWPGVKSFI